MTRSEFIRNYHGFLRSIALKPKDMFVCGGGVLLMYGMREVTDDIDATVNGLVFGLIKTRLQPWLWYQDNHHPSGKLVLQVGPLDIHLEENPPDSVVMKDGVACQSLQDVLALKKRLDRPKDQLDIANIERYLRG